MPLLALILWISYGRRRKRYPQYLYFSLHYHAALFAGLLMTIPLSYIFDTLLLWTLWAFVYFVMALKTVWGGSTKGAIQRTLFTMFVYGIFFVITMGTAALYSVYQLGKTGV